MLEEIQIFQIKHWDYKELLSYFFMNREFCSLPKGFVDFVKM